APSAPCQKQAVHASPGRVTPVRCRLYRQLRCAVTRRFSTPREPSSAAP
ncbi:hypothetical protein CCACVL1_00075, partial [Corchorus capsularis]